MNPAWRMYKGHLEGAEQPDFNDKGWDLVSLPDGIEYVPSEASGCVNYQGEVWYRKHFTPEETWKGKQLFLHFEAIMGKAKVWINGTLVNEHYGGFLPVIANVTEYINYKEDNVIAVWADNSNDPSYPPGKPQDMLDFTYSGGIYRDCWMIVHNNVFITDPNYENETAGGGLFVSFGHISQSQAEIRLDAHVRNSSNTHFSGKIEYQLFDKDNRRVCQASKAFSVSKGKARNTSLTIKVEKPELWEPDSPYLYQLHVLLKINRDILSMGIVDGEVVATHKVMPARRPSQIILWADNEGTETIADGSDLITVIAAIADENGNIKRLNNYHIKFEIEGPGELVASKETFTNPREVQWGTAPILVRAKAQTGNIKIKASVVPYGIHTPMSAELIIPTTKAIHPLIADEDELNLQLKTHRN